MSTHTEQTTCLFTGHINFPLAQRKETAQCTASAWSRHKGENPQQGDQKGRTGTAQQVSLAGAFTGHNKSLNLNNAYTVETAHAVVN